MTSQEPTPAEIDSLRNQFLQKIKEDEKDVHAKDLAKINNDSRWLRRFLLHHDLDIKESLNMLLETCEWRKTNKINEINENNINREYLEDGSLFVHNHDKDGYPLLIFKCIKHVKGQKNFAELKRVLIYWLERIEKQDFEQATVFFDMMDTGINNLDMEYTKYLISICKQYYPFFLNYILIFEMPWVLNAAFKLIKSWLPTKAVQKIKFVTKNNLSQYVDKDQSLVSWGGLDPYIYAFEPLDKEENKKKVHFADGSPLTETFNGFDDEALTSKRVKIVPNDTIMFTMELKELSGVITVTNISSEPISYKIKTTSPEKFKVRPSIGMLQPDAKVTITVILLAGYTPVNIIRDKFLVMTLPLESSDIKNTQLNDIWKSSNNMEKLEEHLLKCRMATTSSLPLNGSTTIGNELSNTELEQKMSQLLISMNHVTDCCFEIRADLKSVRRFNWFLMLAIIILGIFMVYQQRLYESQGSCMVDI